jgi:TonB family protein
MVTLSLPTRSTFALKRRKDDSGLFFRYLQTILIFTVMKNIQKMKTVRLNGNRPCRKGLCKLTGVAAVVLVLMCANPERSHAAAYAPMDPDTTVYSGLDVMTAELENATAWLRANNRYNDWGKSDRKLTVLQGIVEKDGSISNVRIFRSSGVKHLDAEALRLVKSAGYKPAMRQGKPVRSKYSVVIPFPAD